MAAEQRMDYGWPILPFLPSSPSFSRAPGLDLLSFWFSPCGIHMSSPRKAPTPWPSLTELWRCRVYCATVTRANQGPGCTAAYLLIFSSVLILYLLFVYPPLTLALSSEHLLLHCFFLCCACYGRCRCRCCGFYSCSHSLPPLAVSVNTVSSFVLILVPVSPFFTLLASVLGLPSVCRVIHTFPKWSRVSCISLKKACHFHRKN